MSTIKSPASQSEPGTGSSDSSRASAGGAGWGCRREGSFVQLSGQAAGQAADASPRPRTLVPKRLYWFRLRVLWGSRNDFLAQFSDPVPELRNRWVAGRNAEQLRVDLTDRTDFSFLLLGDTGEGDYSQWALVPPLCRVADACDAQFIFLCSDVVYPVGDVNEYGDKFYRPYGSLQRPIYAIPGNHDWYDDLSAFMSNFCEVKEIPPIVGVDDPGATVRSVKTLRSVPGRYWGTARRQIRTWAWRKPSPPRDPDLIERWSRERGAAAQKPPTPQPGPYYVIDTAHMRFVCIDTGIRGDIDARQGRWLVDVSADPRPKILLTGKPLLVNGRVDECAITDHPDGFESVLSVVHHKKFNYVAAIGGDVHNYQHYPANVQDPDGSTRTIHHFVSGGGGAFMHATHTTKVMDPGKVFGVTERDYKAYPLRMDSLAAYSRVVQGMINKLPFPLRLGVELDERQAAMILHETLGTRQERPAATASAALEAVPPISRTRRLASRLLLVTGGQRFHSFFSPFCDWDTPPFFKHFLRIDVRKDGVTIRCYAVTGCGEDEENPPVEDTVTINWPQ